MRSNYNFFHAKPYPDYYDDAFDNMFQRPVVIPHMPGNLQVNLATPNFPHNNNMYSSGSNIHHTPSTSVNTMNNSNQYFNNINGSGNNFATPPSSFAV